MNHSGKITIFPKNENYFSIIIQIFNHFRSKSKIFYYICSINLKGVEFAKPNINYN